MTGGVVRTRMTVAVGCSVLALAACSPAEDVLTPAAGPDPSPPLEAPLPPPAEDVPEPAPPPAAPPAGDCGDAVVDAVDAVIAGQLAALAADDHERALDFASEAFRASFDAEAFEALIDGSYPVVADAAEHHLGRCRQPEPAAVEVEVAVTATDGAAGVFIYLLVDEGGWAVAGALEVEPTEPDVTDV
jgi:hypothetical protein